MHVLSMILPLIGLLVVAILAYYYKVEGVADLRKQTDQIAFHLDGGMISYFKSRAAKVAKGYQRLINDALRDYAGLGGQTNVIADLAERVRQLEEEMATRRSD